MSQERHGTKEALVKRNRQQRDALRKLNIAHMRTLYELEMARKDVDAIAQLFTAVTGGGQVLGVVHPGQPGYEEAKAMLEKQPSSPMDFMQVPGSDKPN